MTRPVALALVLVAIGALLMALVVAPERRRADAATAALAQAREEQRSVRAELAALQARGRRATPATTADPVAVRSRVLAVLAAVPVRDVRLAVRPGATGVDVTISGRSTQEAALQLAQRLVDDAALSLTMVRLDAADTGVRVAVDGRADAP